MITATPQNQQAPKQQNTQPGANEPGAADAGKQAGIIRALATVGEKWKAICGSLISDSETVANPPDPKQFKEDAYAYLALRNGAAVAGIQSLKLILASAAAKKPYFLLLEVVETEAKVDGTQREVIHTALADVAKGADPQAELNNVLVGYLATSDHGKKWWKSDDAKEWVGAFAAYLANDALLTTHAGKGTKDARKAGLLPISNLLATGTFRAADPNAAKDAKDDKKDAKGADAALPAAPTDAQKKKTQDDATALKAKITAVLPKEGEILDRFQMSQWHAKNGMVLFEIAHQPIEVRDLLFHDTAFMKRIALLGEGDKKDGNGRTMQTVFRSLDPVEALYDDLQGQETDKGGGTISSFQNDQKKTLDMLDPKRRFQAILKYLAAHPGKEGQPDRMRAMMHAGIASVISVLGEQQQKDLWKYATRGSLEDTIQDKLNVAVKSKSGEQTARTLLGMGGDDRAVYKSMQDDLIFRQNLCQPELRTPVIIDGVQIVPYDLALTLWGQKPGAVADLGQKGPTESDPDHPNDEDKKPLDAGERKTLDENVYNESVDLLANDLSAADKFGASVRTSDTNVKNHLEDFANKCANEKWVKLLRRGGTPPGQEFVRRFNLKTGKSIQGLVKNACKDATVNTVERILNISVDSASVGTVGAGIGLAGEKDDKAAMSLEQALRETTSGTNGGGPTISIVIHAQAAKLKDELHSTFNVSLANVKEIWAEAQAKIDPQLKTIRDLTKTNVFTIELLQNAYQEIDGPLGPAIDNNVSNDTKKSDIKFALTLTNAQVAGRQVEVGPKPDAKETAKQSAEDLYGSTAKDLFGALMQLDRNAAENQFVNTKSLLTSYMTLRTKGQESNKRVGTEIPPDLKPVKQGDGMPSPETPDDFYRLKYGLTPHNHAIQVARSFRDVDNKKDGNFERGDGANSSRTPDKVAVSLGLGADEVGGAVKAPSEKPLVDETNKGLVRPGFTAERAEGLAKDMWKLLHEGGEIHLIQTMLYGPYNDEEQRLIRLAFRQLSGGIDWQFYIQQARWMNEQNKTPGQANNIGDKKQTMVGGEGTEAGAQAAGGKTIVKVTADKGELDAALAVATQGELDIRDELKNAMAHSQPVSNMGDVNQIFRIIDRCDDGQKKKILADQNLVAELKGKLDDNAWKRVYRVLTGQVSLNDLLESRSHGDYGSFLERQFGGTDEAGMKEDIKMYVRKMRQKFEEDERKAARLKPVPPSAMEMQVAVALKVRDACRQFAANPETNRIIEEELSGPDLSGTRDLIMHQGEESNVAAVAGGDSADAIMAEIKKMKKAERERRLKDPEYMSFLTKKLAGPDLQQAFALLQSDAEDKAAGGGDGLDAPNAGPGNDRLAELKKLAAPGGDGDHNSVLQKLTELTPEEHQKLLADPKLISFVLSKFELTPEKRKVAQKIIGFDAKDADKTLGDKVLWPDAKGAQKCIGRTLTDEDKARLAYLKDNAINRILVGASTSWDNLLAQAVEVYKLDLKPHGVAPTATPKTEPAVSQQPDPQKPVDPALLVDPNKDLYDNVEKELRNAVWAAVAGDAAVKERIQDKAGGDDSVLRNAVLKAPGGDPTQARVKDRWHWLKDDSKGVEDAIDKASGDFLISTWMSVGEKSTKANGQESLGVVYKKYREASDLAKKETPPKQGDDKAPPPQSPAKQAMENAKLAYMNYVIDASNQFEQDLLVQGHAGGLGDDDKATQKDGKRDLTTSRDNPEYNKWRGMLRARIPTLPKQKIAAEIGATNRPDDVALLENPNRQMQTDREFLQDDYLQKFGTVGAGARVAGPERAGVNDAMTNYGKEAAKAETNADGGHGIITEEEQKKLGISKEEVERAMKEFSAARAQIASIAATLVSLVVGAAVTILTGGAGAGVAWMLIAGAISGAAGAAGAALTKSAIQGNEFDMSHEGFQMIAEGAITGLVTAGTTRMASNIMTKLAGPVSSKAQAGAFADLVSGPKPAAWEMILKASGRSGAEMAISQTLTTSMEAGLAPLNPAIWVHGWDEGVINARAAVKEKLHGADKAILQAAIIGILTGGATKSVELIKGGPKAPAPIAPTDKPVVDQRLKTASQSWIDRNTARIGANAEKYMHFDEIALQAFASFAGSKLMQAAGDKPIDWSQVPGEIFTEFINAWNGLAANVHADSRKISVERKARVDEEIKLHKDALKPAEIEHYRSLNPEVSVSEIITVQEYLVARQGMFEAAVAHFEQQNKVQLTPKQRALFQNYCREHAKSSGEYQTLSNSDPRKLNIPGFNEAGFAHLGPDASGNTTTETEKKGPQPEVKQETKPQDKKDVKPEDKKEQKPDEKKPEELKVESGGVGAVGDLFTGQSLEKSDIARIQTEIGRALPLVASLFPGMVQVAPAGLVVKVGDRFIKVTVTTMTAGAGEVARYHMTGDTATIEISDRVRDKHVERAIADMVAEIHATKEAQLGGKELPKQSALGEGGTGKEMSATDIGKLAQIKALLRQLEAAQNPEGGGKANEVIVKQLQNDLNTLLDSLGLGGPGGAEKAKGLIGKGLEPGDVNRLMNLNQPKEAQQHALTEVHADFIQGSDFLAQDHWTVKPEDIKKIAQEALLGSLAAGVIPDVKSMHKVGDDIVVEMTTGEFFKINVAVTQLGKGTLARSLLNTDRLTHVIQLNENIAEVNIRRATAHEIAELVDLHRQVTGGKKPGTVDALVPGKMPPGAQLSGHDKGRAAEMNVLGLDFADAASNPAEQQRVRNEMFALAERLGLRGGDPDTQMRNALLDPHLSPDAKKLLSEARAVADPSASFKNKSATQEKLKTQMAEQEAAMKKAQDESAKLPEGMKLEKQVGDTPLTEAQKLKKASEIESLNIEAEKRRADKSAVVWAELMALKKDPRGDWYQLPEKFKDIQIGGNAAVSALSPETLFFDIPGRWHVDAGTEIAQTAGQLGAMPGLGDAHDFAGTNERVDLNAIRYMINDKAAKSNCVNGFARIMTIEGNVVIEVHVGGEMRRFKMPGGTTPRVATGFPRERFLGGGDPINTIHDLRSRAKKAGIDVDPKLEHNYGERDVDIREWIDWMQKKAPPPKDGKSIQDVLMDPAPGSDPDVEKHLNDNFEALKKWTKERAKHGPDGDQKLLQGDEANETNYKDHPVTTWTVVGSGGTAISAIEIILKQTEARNGAGPTGTPPGPVIVRMLGPTDSAALKDNTQWQELKKKYGQEGEGANKNRLLFDEKGERMKDFKIGPDGKFQVTDKNGAVTSNSEGLVISIGRDGTIPPAFSDVVYQAELEQRKVEGELLFDERDHQYLGYRIKVTGKDKKVQSFDVTGATSRFLPPKYFKPEVVQQVGALDGPVEQRDAPDGAGRFGGGLSSSVNQALRLRQQMERIQNQGKK